MRWCEIVMIHVYRRKNGDLWCAVATEDDKVLGTAFAINEGEDVKQVIEGLPYNEPFETDEKLSQLAEKILDTMKSILMGKSVSWNFTLEQSHLSEYAKNVLDCLTKVPVGYVTTYKALAKSVGGGPRAVGQIMASNPFAPLIPCHRVIKSDFSIGGFGGFGAGVKLKRALLQREDRDFQKPSQVKTKYGALEVYPIAFLRKE
jgi:methylated-DNA-[protein]-cysteine S-methyltransferase